MNRPALFAVLAGVGVGACTTGPGSMPAPRWELNPASTAAQAQGETEVSGHSKELGVVKGTQSALDNFHRPMVAFEGRSSAVVEPCRRAASAQAKDLGAVWVEAALAGPEVRSRGRTTAPVFIRVLYKNEKGHEVRQAQVSCTIDGHGRLVDLKTGG